jgi:hypothetical protein
MILISTLTIPSFLKLIVVMVGAFTKLFPSTATPYLSCGQDQVVD